MRQWAIRRRVLAVSALVFVGAAGVALASEIVPSSATGASVIHACAKKDGEVRIVDAAASCKREETSLTWNVQGPKGDTGPAGAKGADGQSVVLGDAGTHCPAGGIAVTAAAVTRYVCNGATGATGATGPAGATGPQGPPGSAGSGSGSLAGTPCTRPEGDVGVIVVSVAASSHVVTLTCVSNGATTTATTATTTAPTCVVPPPGNHATYGCDGNGNVVVVSCDPGGFVNFLGDAHSTPAFDVTATGCPFDPSEPTNNTLATAVELMFPSLGTSTSPGDNYVSGSDEDWYRFTATPGPNGVCSVGFAPGTLPAPGSGTNIGATIDVFRDGTLIGGLNDFLSPSPIPAVDTPGTCSTYTIHARYSGYMALWLMLITNDGS